MFWSLKTEFLITSWSGEMILFSKCLWFACLISVLCLTFWASVGSWLHFSEWSQTQFSVGLKFHQGQVHSDSGSFTFQVCNLIWLSLIGKKLRTLFCGLNWRPEPRGKRKTQSPESGGFLFNSQKFEECDKCHFLNSLRKAPYFAEEPKGRDTHPSPRATRVERKD